MVAASWPAPALPSRSVGRPPRRRWACCETSWATASAMVSDPRRHGFCRLAAAIPPVMLSDPDANATSVIELAEQAAVTGAAVVAFPELCLTGYSNEDLIQQRALLDA